MWTDWMHILGIVVWVVLMAWLIWFSMRHFVRVTRNVQDSIRLLFKDFSQKMWMTVGLGVLFFGIYALLVFIGSLVINSKTRLEFFFLLYKHPIDFIYLGLLAFACTSLCIYIARMVIKYLYNTRNK